MKSKFLLPFLTLFVISCVNKGPYDVVDQPNDKIGILFENAVAKEKERVARGQWYSGIMPSATKRMDDYLKSIKYIESYASKGTESSDKFNNVEIRIMFKDGEIVDKLFTGRRVIQAFGMGAQFLTKMELLDGKVVSAYTNGAEKGNAPDYIQSDIELIKETVLRYDWRVNGKDYYYPAKTQEDVTKEWENIK